MRGGYMDNEVKLDHQSGVNREGEPFIQLINGDKLIGQMSPEDARDHALAMIEAAEAAEQDAFLIWFVKTQLKGDEKMAVSLLGEFRQWREKRSGIQSGQKLVPDQGFPKA
jgi:hypothetical protein